MSKLTFQKAFWYCLNNYIEISSLVISLVAVIVLYLTYLQYKKINKYNTLSIVPRLDIHIDRQTNTSNQKITEITITAILQNNGLGTAIIKKISLIIDNKETKDKDPMDFIVEKIKDNCSVKTNIITTFYLGKEGHGLLSRDSIILAKMKFLDEPSEEDEKMIDSFNIKIYYESLDGNKYICQSK